MVCHGIIINGSYKFGFGLEVHKNELFVVWICFRCCFCGLWDQNLKVDGFFVIIVCHQLIWVSVKFDCGCDVIMFWVPYISILDCCECVLRRVDVVVLVCDFNCFCANDKDTVFIKNSVELSCGIRFCEANSACAACECVTTAENCVFSTSSNICCAGQVWTLCGNG